MPAEAVLEKARAVIQDGIAELDGERDRLGRALAELSGKPAKRGPGRPRGSGGKAKRKRRSGTRIEQALALIEQEPGITAKDIGKALKLKPNYLYRILGEAEKEGKCRKDGRKYYPPAS